ncbi:GvpL/GvpF family gas vesicle protein [Phormidesmis sp. 146-12]
MYTYAFFKTPALSLNVLPGIEGEVQVVNRGELSALIEPDLDLEAVQRDDNQLVQAVLTHDRMICELFWQTTILPLRFGTFFVSLDSLLDHLESNQATYLAKLSQLEGKAEYRLKITPLESPEDPLPPDLKGKQYFLAKKEQYATQQALKNQQMSELQILMSAIAQFYPDRILTEAKAGVEKLYLLADRQQEATLYDRLQTWQNECSHWELMLGEALPPYHFV